MLSSTTGAGGAGTAAATRRVGAPVVTAVRHAVVWARRPPRLAGRDTLTRRVVAAEDAPRVTGDTSSPASVA